MGSITPHPSLPQPRKTRSISAVRERAIVERREQWTAKWVMRGMRVSRSYGAARNVLFALLLLADGAFYISVSAREISEIAGISYKQVWSHLHTLYRLGEVSLDQHGGGRAKKNCYRLDIMDDGTGGDAA
jgi:hypothetical protein